MKTKFPYEGSIPYEKYWEEYMKREDAVRSIPSEGELKEQAIHAIVKDSLELLPIPEGEAAEEGDTVTMAVSSEIARFNKSKVTVSLGRGLYNKDLELAAVGKKVGDAFTLIIQEKPVSASILEIKRKTAPQPTDEMVVNMGVKNDEQKPITTVDEYISYTIENKRLIALSTVDYYIMQEILKDYPITEYEESDIARLRELEKECFHKLFLEHDNLDLYKDVPGDWKEHGINTFEEWLDERYEWYKMKIQQCFVRQNILGLPDEGETDPLDHYEVLSELTQKCFDMVEKRLQVTAE